MTPPSKDTCATTNPPVYVNPLRMACDARFYFWTALLVAGFVYVWAVLCKRPIVWQPYNEEYREMLKLLFSAPLLYYFGPRHALATLREDGYRAFLLNGLAFVLPFFTALHFIYLQNIRGLNYSLTPSDLQRMPLMAVAVFSLCGLIILALALYHLYLARREGVLLPYSSLLIAAILLIGIITWAVREHYYFHFHHYFFFGFFIPFLRFKNPVSLICLGVCAGVYAEGVAEWGMDPIWLPVH